MLVVVDLTKKHLFQVLKSSLYLDLGGETDLDSVT